MMQRYLRLAGSKAAVSGRIWLAFFLLVLPLLVLEPSAASAAPPTDPNVLKTWTRTDQPVAAGQVARSWLWGPKSFYSGFEDYSGAAGGYGQPAGTRPVYYFDKSRMEINNINGDRNSKWFITNGLLVKELITGRRATSDNTFVPYLPAQVPVAGDPDPNVDGSAPTYAALYGVTSFSPGQNAAPNLVDKYATLTLDRNGNPGDDLSRYGQVKIAVYDPVFGHNIPKPFWDYMNSSGLVLENDKAVTGPVVDWGYSVGYPISEPYWVSAIVAGQKKDVMLQAFERRVLTYTPSNDAAWQVEMGNVGMHYYRWRYEAPTQTCDTTPVRGFGKVWANNPTVQARIGCPVTYPTGEQKTNLAIQNFEHGKMIWVDTSPTPNYYPISGWQKTVYVLFDDGTYGQFQDTWDSSQPEKAGLTPPSANLYEPRRGFGKIWRDATGLKVRERLGWATETVEKGGDGAIQDFWRGSMIWAGPTNDIVVLYRYYNQNNLYEMYKDA